MKIILLIVIAGIVLYFLLKLCLYLLRPFFLSKALREIDQIYNNTLAYIDKDLNLATENYNNWHKGDAITRCGSTEEEITNRLNYIKKEKEHEKEVYKKFFRLNERFSRNHDKLSESIIAYRKYLGSKARQQVNSDIFVNALTCKAMTVDDFISEGEKAKITLEENEKRLDDLLA